MVVYCFCSCFPADYHPAEDYRPPADYHLAEDYHLVAPVACFHPAVVVCFRPGVVVLVPPPEIAVWALPGADLALALHWVTAVYFPAAALAAAGPAWAGFCFAAV